MYYDPPEPKEIPEDAIREALENKAEEELSDLPVWDRIGKRQRARLIRLMVAIYEEDGLEESDEIQDAAIELLAYRERGNE